MANNVRVSSVSAPITAIRAEMPMESQVDLMIQGWERQLEPVLHDQPDIVVLPEMCDRPTMYPKDRVMDYFRSRGDRILDMFRETARQHRCYIAYPSAYEMPDGTYRNSMLLIDREGEIAGKYHKNHLTILESEQRGYLYGKEAPVFETDFGKVACAICFDLNFEELRLKYAAAKPDMILFGSAYHGGLMQSYWAYSCRAYFVGSIATMKSPCTILSPLGEILGSSSNYFPFVTKTVNLDSAVIHLDFNRNKFNEIKKKYKTLVSIETPPYLGAALLSSESDQFRVEDIIAEFEIEVLDDYFDRSRAHRAAPGRMED